VVGLQSAETSDGISGHSIEFRNVSIRFNSFVAVSGVTLRVEPGEFICLIGPSGCGKSTLLSAAAGFLNAGDEAPGGVHGEVLVDGAPVRGPDVSRGVVFQSSESLFPWRTVRENVEFGPRIRGIRGAQLRALTDQYIALVGLEHAADRFPSQLSGGMRQRVQLARVLVNEPKVVLMDEPLGALDAQTRSLMQQEIERLWQATQSTFIFVTHDLDEAIKLGDRVVTMTAGPTAGIKKIYKIDLNRPRDETSPTAIELHRALRADVSVEVLKTLKAQAG
jgi:NitT/TauT family transport system ATP-binding protein